MNISVEYILNNKNRFLKLVNDSPTPTYIFDRVQTQSAIADFTHAFSRHVPRLKVYYAIKSNPFGGILDEVIAAGHGLDVSSGRELQLAMAHKRDSVLFTGPGKTDEELTLALDYADRVIINIDSFGELRRLNRLTNLRNVKVSAGVRIAATVHGAWKKFGIPLDRLSDFWAEAQQYPGINLMGIQTHMSWNTDAAPFDAVFSELGAYITNKMSPESTREIKFIDFGGGYVPDGLEGNFESASFDLDVVRSPAYTMERSLPVEQFAQKIGKSIKKHLSFLDCDYIAEPGRIISTYSMHIALKIIDVKSERDIVLDGGNNMIGWEKYEQTYAPVVNISNPATLERPYVLYGSLCTPHDVWGYYCYASKMQEGDILIIPNQGAYTYTLAQNFIKSEASVAYS